MTEAEDAAGRVERLRRPSPAAVLELVHRGRGLTRSELTARTGLNRSTVGGIVAALADLGLVVETEDPAPRRVGRPSPFVAPHPAPAVLAVNPEVDAIELALVGLGAAVAHRERIELPRPPTPGEVAEAVAGNLGTLRAAAPGRRVLGVGLAVPGLVREADGVVRWAPHLDWREAPLARLVAEATGLPARAANDASLGAIAEHRFGAGRGVDDLVYLNGGASGIGGGVIVAGSPRGAAGYAGEFGQTRPGLAAPEDRATERGSLEDEVSRGRVLGMLGLDSADEAALHAAIERALAAGDPVLGAELQRQRRVLAVALANAIDVLAPRAVVLGGYLASILARDPGALEDAVAAAAVPAAMETVEILPAGLGADRLLIGAGELALEPLLADPAAGS